MSDDASWILEWAGVHETSEADTPASGEGILALVEHPEQSQFFQVARDLAEAFTWGVQVVLVGEVDRAVVEQQGFSVLTTDLTTDLAAEHVIAGAPLTSGTFDRWVNFIREQAPKAVLFQETQFARYLAPYLAEQLGVGLAGPAVQFSYDLADQQIIQTVPYYEGRLNVDIITRGTPQLLIVKA